MLHRLIDHHGGLISTAELHVAGWGRRGIQAAIERGEIFRVRQGWYARPGIAPEHIAAARVGGRVSCGTALRMLGVWVDAPGLHIAVRPNACRLRDPGDSRRRLEPSDVRIHWDDGAGTSRLRVDPLHALRDLARCASVDALVAAADSLQRVRPDLRREWPDRLGAFGQVLRAELEMADGVCESGTETYFWRRMRRRLPLRRQVQIASVGRVDCVIGHRLVVEIDGAAYHTDPAAFERDRRRDALLTALGYRVLRFSYRQVMERWGEVEAAVLAAVARLDHI